MSIRRPNVGVLTVAIVAAVLAVPAISSASLIQLAVPGPDTNNAVQAATRILELQSPGATSTESGCVAWNGAADVFTCSLGPALPAFSGGDQKPQTQTRTAGSLGIDGGSDLRIAFDAVEPAGNGITLDALRLLILNPTTGGLIFSADLAAPITLASTLQGNGKSDLLLGLDLAQAAALDAAVAASAVPLANVRIGLYSNLSAATGGFEGFYVGDVATLGIGDIIVPEPASLLLIGAGLGLFVRFRRHTSNR